MAERFLGGMILGAGLVWFLDPRRGGQRRGVVRDKMIHAAKELEEAARVGGHDLVNRAHGLKAEMTSLGRPGPGDARLEQRVRAQLGRVCSHTRALGIHADGHRVRLEGPVLESEAEEIVRAVAHVRGVDEVESHLELHADASGVPSLQGEHEHRRPRRLPPAAHLIIGAGSAALALAALARGSAVGFAVGSVGTFASAHAITQRNRPLRGLRPTHRREPARKEEKPREPERLAPATSGP